MGTMPKAEREKLAVLQRRSSQLVSMLPDVESIMNSVDLDPAEYQSFHASIELIAAELSATTAAMQTILEEVKRRSTSRR